MQKPLNHRATRLISILALISILLSNTGTTTLRGGIITSSAKAEAEGKNSFSTDRLVLEDVHNQSEHKGKASGITLGINDRQSTRSIGYGHDSDHQADTTRSSINTANLIIRDEAGQRLQSGQSAAQTATLANRGIHLDTAKANSGALSDHFDADKVQRELDAQVAITQDFGEVAPQITAKAADALAHSKEYNEAKLNALAAEAILTHPDSKATERSLAYQALNQANATINQYQNAQDMWGEGSIGRAALHAGMGGFATGDISGALGAGTVSLASPTFNKISKNLNDTGKVLFNSTAGLALGGVVGGQGGMMTGANTDWNNRQLHPYEIKQIDNLSKKMAENDVGDLHLTPEQWKARLSIMASSMIDSQNNQLVKSELSREAWISSLEFSYLPGMLYINSLITAQDALTQEAQKNHVIQWNDGTPIQAYGDNVHAFQATKEQKQDHHLFGFIKPITIHGYDNPRKVKGYSASDSIKHYQEISDFYFSPQNNINIAKQLEHDYYTISGTGELHRTYPELWLGDAALAKSILQGGGKYLLNRISTSKIATNTIHRGKNIITNPTAGRRLSEIALIPKLGIKTSINSSKHFSSKVIIEIEPKIYRQMATRGWSKESIEAVIRNPTRKIKTRDTRFNPETGNKLNDPATGYISNDGSYVIRNDITGQIVQISNKNKPSWLAPWDKK